MRAFHSTWTGPFFKSQKGDFYVEDFELLTTILSALKWSRIFQFFLKFPYVGFTINLINNQISE